MVPTVYGVPDRFGFASLALTLYAFIWVAPSTFLAPMGLLFQHCIFVHKAKSLGTQVRVSLIDYRLRLQLLQVWSGYIGKANRPVAAE